MPSFLSAIIMHILVRYIGFMTISPLLLIVLQVAVGILFYLFFSFVFKPEAYILLLGVLKKVLKPKVN